MRRPFEIRTCRADDLWSVNWLRSLAGWNQSASFWGMLMGAPSAESWVASWGGGVVGSSVLWRYGSEMAWIGMVIVHPAYRRRGIARTLLKRCLDACQERGVARIGLDATPVGRELYSDLGFVETDEMIRHERAALSGELQMEAQDGSFASQREFSAIFDHAVLALDREGFGANRNRLIEQLAGECRLSLVVRDPLSGDLGYGMVRRGAGRLYLGPAVFSRTDLGRFATRLLLDESKPQPLIWDIPLKNETALDLAGECGFVERRRLHRMWLGADGSVPVSPKVWAIADPAVG